MPAFYPLRHRLRAQGLAGARFASAGDVVGWLGAVQSQEYALAKWSVAQRARGVTLADVDAALASGTIVRTHLLRPTWHFVLPADLRWMQRLTAPRVRAMLASADRKLGLGAAVLRRARAAIVRALEGGRARTRTELAAALEEVGLDAAGQRLAHLVMHSELDALICSGAPRGKQQTYVLVDESIPPTPELDRDEALAELAARYFTSHGPATLRDFRWWSSLGAADARRAIEAAGDRLTRTEVAERTYWHADGAALPTAKRSPTAHLLQIYDELVVGYTESRHLLSLDPLARGGFVRGSAMLHPVVLDGEIVGSWRRVGRGRAEEIELKPLAKLARHARAELDRAVERFRAFTAGRAARRAS